MKPIQKDELYAHLGQFLKAKGIAMTEGSYAQGIQKACAILTDTINLSQRGLERAKQEIDKKFEKVREVIHEKTAPRQAAKPAAAAKAAKAPKPPPKKAPAKSAKGRKPAAGKKKS